MSGPERPSQPRNVPGVVSALLGAEFFPSLIQLVGWGGSAGVENAPFLHELTDGRGEFLKFLDHVLSGGGLRKKAPLLELREDPSGQVRILFPEERPGQGEDDKGGGQGA